MGFVLSCKQSLTLPAYCHELALDMVRMNLPSEPTMTPSGFFAFTWVKMVIADNILLCGDDEADTTECLETGRRELQDRIMAKEESRLRL